MSHQVTFNIKARLIECEELIKNINNMISEFNMREEVVNLIFRQFNLNSVINELHFTNDFDEVMYNKVTSSIEQIRQFFSNIDTYLVYNNQLNADDYNKRVEDLTAEFIKNDPNILENALLGVESEIKRMYIISQFKQKKYTSIDALLADVENSLKDSKQYQKELVLENVRKLSEMKKIKIDDSKNISSAILQANTSKADEEVSIAVRNRVTTAIIKIIKQQGFIVKKENVIQKGEDALILANKPSGEEVRFKINLQGKFIYKFHKYEGLSCEKDIKNFEELFESVYGIKLENRTITWSNPDRLDKMAHQTIKMNKIGG